MGFQLVSSAIFSTLQAPKEKNRLRNTWIAFNKHHSPFANVPYIARNQVVEREGAVGVSNTY